MLKAIIFDVDNTLYSEKAAHAVAFAKVQDYAREHFSIAPDLWSRLCAEEAAQVKALLGPQAAIHNRMIRFLRILEKQGLPLYHARVLSDLYWNTLVENARPEPGVRDCLLALKKQGYTLGVGTNMTLDWQMAKLEKIGLIDLFAFLLSSEEAGIEKPEAGFFRLCAQYAQAEPAECLYVGDSLQGDVLAAENAGMTALWYQPGLTDFSPHPGFSQYSQLQNRISML